MVTEGVVYRRAHRLTMLRNGWMFGVCALNLPWQTLWMRYLDIGRNAYISREIGANVFVLWGGDFSVAARERLKKGDP